MTFWEALFSGTRAAVLRWIFVVAGMGSLLFVPSGGWAQDQTGNCPPAKGQLEKKVLDPVSQAVEQAGNGPDPLPALLSNMSAVLGAAGIDVEAEPAPMFAERPTLVDADADFPRVAGLEIADMNGDRIDDLVIETAGTERKVTVYEGSAVGISPEPSHTRTIPGDQSFFEAALDIYIDIDLASDLDLGEETTTTAENAQTTEDELLAADLALAKSLDAQYEDHAPQHTYAQRMRGWRGPTAEEVEAFYQQVAQKNDETFTSIEVVDFNGNGLRGALVTVPRKSQVRLYIDNTAQVAWHAELETAQGDTFGDVLAWGDLNDDGAIDLVTRSNPASGVGSAWVFYGTPTPQTSDRHRERPKS